MGISLGILFIITLHTLNIIDFFQLYLNEDEKNPVKSKWEKKGMFFAYYFFTSRKEVNSY